MAVMTGGRFTSFTMMLMARESERMGVPLSRTMTVTVLVPGPWVSVGIHETIPVFGSIVMPLGTTPRNCQVNVCAGRSESVAPRKITELVSSFKVTCDGALVITGAELTSLTWTTTVCVALRLGD